MAKTSTESVKNTFGIDKINENSISENQIIQTIDDASIQVDIDKVPAKYVEYAERLYACHLLTASVQASNSSDSSVILEKVGALQTQYKNYDGTNKYDDLWEATYNKLLTSLGLRGGTGRFI